MICVGISGVCEVDIVTESAQICFKKVWQSDVGQVLMVTEEATWKRRESQEWVSLSGSPPDAEHKALLYRSPSNRHVGGAHH